MHSRGQRNIFKEKGAAGVIFLKNALFYGKVKVAQPPRLYLEKGMVHSAHPTWGLSLSTRAFFFC